MQRLRRGQAPPSRARCHLVQFLKHPVSFVTANIRWHLRAIPCRSPAARLLGNAVTRWLHSAFRRLAAPGRAAPMTQAMRSAGRASLGRVPSNDAASIDHAGPDVGASTVVVPMVDTAEDAHRAATACWFPPMGRRSR